MAIRVAALVLLVLAVGFLWEASRYPFGSPTAPGPGFLPMTLGTAFLVLAALLAIRPGAPPEHVLPPDRDGAVRIAATILLLGLAIALLDRLGFLVCGTLLMLSLLLVVDRRWIRAVILAPSATVAVYLVFKVWLRVPLPAGLLSF